MIQKFMSLFSRRKRNNKDEIKYYVMPKNKERFSLLDCEEISYQEAKIFINLHKLDNLVEVPKIFQKNLRTNRIKFLTKELINEF